MIDIVCGYTDPAFGIAGHIYCDSAEQALDLAAKHGGNAWVEFWSDGNPVGRSELVHLEEVANA